jgi:RNA polymerase sigma factor (TIGR02999 family)
MEEAPTPSGEMTALLQAATEGSRRSADRLLEAVYDDLRKLAASYLRSERPDHTLQPTALVHEAYLRLIDQSRVDWRNRSHFFAVAAQAMRRLLVDHARRRRRLRHGGDRLRVTLSGIAADSQDARSIDDVVAIDQALAKLALTEPEKAGLVELRFFGGLTAEEAAEVMGVSLRTVERYWLHARTWMYRELEGSPHELPS